MSLHTAFSSPPLIVGIGGTQRSQSSSELAAKFALSLAQGAGASTVMLDGRALSLPLYNPAEPHRDERAMELVKILRNADGIIIACPAYHGGISGLIKNALDYTEDMRDDDRCYFDGRAVGTITCAAGWQAAATTLSALRSVVHSLRGWNTPLGVMINTAGKVFEGETCVNSDVARNISIMVEQVIEFARMARTSKVEAKDNRPSASRMPAYHVSI